MKITYSMDHVHTHMRTEVSRETFLRTVPDREPDMRGQGHRTWILGGGYLLQICAWAS